MREHAQAAQTRLPRMDAPPIQYARTDDGVNIAYSAMGNGPPLVMCDGSFLGLATGWGDAAGRLARSFRV